MKLLLVLGIFAAIAILSISAEITGEESIVFPKDGRVVGSFPNRELVRNKRSRPSWGIQESSSGSRPRSGSSWHPKDGSVHVINPFNRVKESDEILGRRYQPRVRSSYRPAMNPFNRVKESDEFFGRRIKTGRTTKNRRAQGRAMAISRIPGEASEEFFGR